MKTIFESAVANKFITRINTLEISSKRLWGKMDSAQMLAHLNVAYEYVYDNKHSKPKGLKLFFLKKFIKPLVVNGKPYKKNGRTAPDFVMADKKNFENEKTRLINFIKKTQELGIEHFENKESHSFGKLTVKEWNNMFSNHMNHHLSQFGA